MSIYQELVHKSVDVSVIKKDAKEVIFNLVSCMCDNRYQLTVKKNSDGEFRLGLGRFAVSNLQMNGDYNTDITWAADEADWDAVVRVIKTGTSAIESIRSR